MNRSIGLIVSSKAGSRRRLDPRINVQSARSASGTTPAKLTLRLPDGTQRRLTSKGAFNAPAGAVIEMEAPGSGGYGPPPGRDRGLIAQDLLDGYVTIEAAKRDYGPDAI
jgi:N-methylhydantoinase B/oxoprolinase/acetone carboxylase alpha subunit